MQGAHLARGLTSNASTYLGSDQTFQEVYKSQHQMSVTILKEAGFSDREVCYVTGHKNPACQLEQLLEAN